jgi:cell division protein FtsI (penicillin-binding protein 3)
MTRAPAPRLRRAPEPPATINPWIRLRIAITGAMLILLLMAIGYRAYGIQVRDADHYRDLARRQHVANVQVPAPRGAIYDTAGVELAVTANIDSVYANPRRVKQPARVAAALGQVLDIDETRIRGRLESDRHFAWIARHVSADQAAAVRALDLPGIALTPEPRRFYPARAITGPVLGFANIDGDGLDGVELAMNELLRGVRGELAALRDARGRIMLPELPSTAEPGASITLTLDRYIQHSAHRAITAAVEHNKASAGTIVVLDVKTGGVLAMASYPSYDPNAPAAGLGQGARNRSITDAYEPGSIIKVFLAAAALDAGVVTPDTTFDVEGGRMRIGRHTIRDTSRNEELDVGGIIKRSSNVGSVKLAKKLGEKAYYEALRRYGFAERSGIELPGERAGLLRPYTSWREIEFATMSYGYGMMATPLQLTAALAAVGNRGVYNPPRIIERAVSASGEILFDRATQSRQQSRRVMSPEAAEALWPMLASVFDGGPRAGTAQHVHVDGYRAGGKTGTALKVNPDTGGYFDDVYMSSFAGLAPIDDPKIAVLVMVDEPRGEHYYGGPVAGPAFASVVSESLRYLGVPPSDEPPPAKPAGSSETRRPRAPPVPAPRLPIVVAPSYRYGLDPDYDHALATAPRMPDVRGLGLPRAIERARETCREVIVEGSGVAHRQHPPEGTPVVVPGECRIEFAPRGREPR